MKPQGKFYIVFEMNQKVKMNPFIDKEALPIIWNQDGNYRIIPMAVIKNAFDSLEIYKKLASGKTVNPIVVIHWNQGIPMSNAAGRALLGE